MGEWPGGLVSDLISAYVDSRMWGSDRILENDRM